MSKRIDLPVNLTELTLLEDAFNKLNFTDLKTDEKKAYMRLGDLIAEFKAELEENEEHSRMYSEDKDGYESLTEYGRNSLAEKYKA